MADERLDGRNHVIGAAVIRLTECFMNNLVIVGTTATLCLARCVGGRYVCLGTCG